MIINRIVFLPIFLVLAIAGIAAGADDQPYPQDVVNVLDSAGTNRAELEKVLTHYGASEDSLKREAVRYLIGNMSGHCYATYVLKDTNDKEVPFSIFDYPSYDSLQNAFSALEKTRGTLDFKRKELIYDLKTITGQYLISQIDFAFRAWNEKPWARHLPQDIFFAYVLPYRSSNEPLEPWREYFWDKYKDIRKEMVDTSDAIEAARIINGDVMSWFTFDPRYYYHPTDQGLAEMLEKHKGRCEDMTNLAIYAMRANGLAVTSDYTPAWADVGNNHAWNAIVTPDRRVIPFMGAESSPGQYQLAHKAAKIYRKTFGEQKENLAFLPNKQKKIPGWLAGKSYIDVTSNYEKTCDVTVTLDQPLPDSVEYAYLCVFNSGEWQAIQWGRIVGGQVTFLAMGTDIAYLPAFYINEKIVPAGAPLILKSDCTRRELKPQAEAEISLQLTSTTRRQQEASTDGIAKAFFEPGIEYELNYWDNDWRSGGKIIAGDKPLIFDKVPSGCLYWLVASGSDREERIFTYEDGRQVWW